MKIENTYLLVKKILTECPETRGSDKLLLVEFYRRQGIVQHNLFVGGACIKVDEFIRVAKMPETIRRSRAEIQSDHKAKLLRGEIDAKDALLPPKRIEKLRQEIAEQRGTHIFRDETITNNEQA